MIPNGPWCYGLSLPPRFTWSVNARQGPEDVQNLTTCQVCPPLPVINSCPSMSP